jgi:hypothetical protein
VGQHIYIDEIRDGVARKIRVDTNMLGQLVMTAHAGKGPHPLKGKRPAVLAYAGDHDASGDDIFRDFVERTDPEAVVSDDYITVRPGITWAAVHRIALTREQVWPDGLDGDPAYPINTGKEDEDGDPTDPRAPEFMRRNDYDENYQVEMDAISPPDLRQLYKNVVDRYWDQDVYDAVIEREDEERERLVLADDDDPDEDSDTD